MVITPKRSNLYFKTNDKAPSFDIIITSLEVGTSYVRCLCLFAGGEEMRAWVREVGSCLGSSSVHGLRSDQSLAHVEVEI